MASTQKGGKSKQDLGGAGSCRLALRYQRPQRLPTEGLNDTGVILIACWRGDLSVAAAGPSGACVESCVRGAM